MRRPERCRRDSKDLRLLPRMIWTAAHRGYGAGRAASRRIVFAKQNRNSKSFAR